MKTFTEVHLSDHDLIGTNSKPTLDALRRTLKISDELRLHLWAVTTTDVPPTAGLREVLAQGLAQDKVITLVDTSIVVQMALGVQGERSGEIRPLIFSA